MWGKALWQSASHFLVTKKIIENAVKSKQRQKFQHQIKAGLVFVVWPTLEPCVVSFANDCGFIHKWFKRFSNSADSSCQLATLVFLLQLYKSLLGDFSVLTKSCCSATLVMKGKIKLSYACGTDALPLHTGDNMLGGRPRGPNSSRWPPPDDQTWYTGSTSSLVNVDSLSDWFWARPVDKLNWIKQRTNTV